MNRIYRLVWSTARHAWVAACEFATARRKAGRGVVVGTLAASALCGLAGEALAGTPYTPGSTAERNVSGNPGLYVNDASNDSGCVYVHDTGDTGSTGWKYDGNNTNCLTGDKASQTSRVLFYGTGKRTNGTDSLTLGDELFVNGGRIGLNNKIDGSNSMAIGNVNDPEGTLAAGADAIAIGNNAHSLSQGASAFGTGATVASESSQGLAVGNNALVQGTKGIAIGNAAQTLSNDALSLGNGATVNQGATDSLALGNNSQVAANANKATALGFGANAQASGSMALGESSVAGAANSVAMGSGAAVNGTSSTGSLALGQGSSVSGANSMAIGTNSTAASSNAMVLGSGARAAAQGSVVVGNGASINDSTSTGSLAMGQGSSISGANSVALGFGSSVTKSNSVAIGRQASSTAADAIALGRNATASAFNSAALGANSTTTADLQQQAYVPAGATSVAGGVPDGEVSIGRAGDTTNAPIVRRLTNLAAGAADTDGVNVSQLKALGGQVADNDAGAVKYERNPDGSINYNMVMMAGDTYDNSTHQGGTTLTNVANGVQDSDAVNVSQLNDLAHTPLTFLGNAGSVQKKLGETVVIQGAASTPGSYTGSNLRTEVDANGDLQLQMADNPVFDSVTTGNTLIDNNGLTIAGGPSVTSGGIDAGNQKIVNVAPGTISDSSADAINGSQLHSTNQQVEQNTTIINHLNTNIENGTVGPVQRSGTDTLSLIASGGDAYAPGNAQVLTNVAAGAISPTSTDAVNGSQLHETNQNVSNIDNRVTNVDNRVSNVFGDDSDGNVAVNGRGIRYVRTNDNGLPVDDAYAQGQGSTAVGYQARAAGNGALALGRNASATADNSVALGANSTTTANLNRPAFMPGWAMVAGTATGEVSVGSAGAERRVTNVAAGADETDAVNVSQLRGVADRTEHLAQDALLWDPSADGGNGAYNANHGGRGPTRIVNVAAGDISATSTDAVNGSQLYAVTTQISNITLGGFKYFHANSQKADSVASGPDSIAVGPAAQASGLSSLAMGDGAAASADNASAVGSNATASAAGATAVGSAASASGSSSVAVGEGAAASGERSSAIGAGASAQAANSVALGADSLADRDNSVSVGSAGNERQITNVKAGEADTDAVNVSQLREHGDTINSSLSNVDNRVTQAKTDITQLQNGTDGMFQVNNSSALPKPRPSGTDALAGGAGAEASGSNSAAVGTRARASGNHATAVGNGSSAQADNSVALGANSVADRANSVSVGSAGNERQITNVAAGSAPTDAVNLSQLQQSMGDISNQFYDYTDSRYNALRHDLKKQDDILSAGIAGAMAMATLPQPHSPGASMATVGLGNYRGQGALAVGVSRISDNGKWVTKLQGTTSSQGEAGVAVGIGYQW